MHLQALMAHITKNFMTAALLTKYIHHPTIYN